VNNREEFATLADAHDTFINGVENFLQGFLLFQSLMAFTDVKQGQHQKSEDKDRQENQQALNTLDAFQFQGLGLVDEFELILLFFNAL
jgi:hypothetical protein